MAEVVEEVEVVRVVKDEVVMDERLTRHDTKEMDKALGYGANMAANDVAAGGGVEDGEVDVGVGVGGVEEATKRDGERGVPEVEDAEDVDEVLKEGAVFVPTLAGADGAEDGDEGREVGVDGGEVIAKERAS